MADKPLSSQEKKIFDLLSAATRPLSAYDILESLRPEGVRSPPTVYRALDSLAARGFVHRLETLNAFVVCRCGARAHTAGHSASFAICSRCGCVMEINDTALRHRIHEAAHSFLAKVEEEVLEIKGLCQACAKQQDKGACSCLH